MDVYQITTIDALVLIISVQNEYQLSAGDTFITVHRISIVHTHTHMRVYNHNKIDLICKTHLIQLTHSFN